MSIKGIKAFRSHCAAVHRQRLQQRERKEPRAPLFSWFYSAPENVASKIEWLDENGFRARFPYRTLSGPTYEAAKRIAKKHRVTWLQYDLILDYLSCFYPGRVSRALSTDMCGLYSDDFSTSPILCERSFVHRNFEIHDALREFPSLRVLLDPQTTAMILVMQSVDVLNPYAINQIRKHHARTQNYA